MDAPRFHIVGKLVIRAEKHEAPAVLVVVALLAIQAVEFPSSLAIFAALIAGLAALSIEVKAITTVCAYILGEAFDTLVGAINARSSLEFNVHHIGTGETGG